MLSGIGSIPDTIKDRSIEICMERRPTMTRLPRFREEKVKEEVAPLKDALARLKDTPEFITLLKHSVPRVPEQLSDRQMDISEPLLAIADLAGNDWGKTARESLVELFTADSLAEDSIGITLLTDIRTVFGGFTKLPTLDLLKGLIEVDTGSPWAEKWESKLRSGQVSTCANQLAKLLKPHGIAPKQIRFNSAENIKGYEREMFTNAWASYCTRASQNTGENRETGKQPRQTPRPAKVDHHHAAHGKQEKCGPNRDLFRCFPKKAKPARTLR